MKNSKETIMERRNDIRDLILQGWKDRDIMKKFNIGPVTLKADKDAIGAEYLKAVTSSEEMMHKQAEAVMKHLDQLDMIKKKLWEIEKDATLDTRSKLETLKTLLQELAHESRVLKLIDNSNTVVKNYIHIDKITVMMDKLTEVIREFVPPDKQGYAFARIRDLGPILDVQAITDETDKKKKVIDNEKEDDSQP